VAKQQPIKKKIITDPKKVGKPLPIPAVKANPYAMIVIIVLGAMLYANTLTHDYALDDAIVIYDNQFTSKGIAGIPDIFRYDTFTGFWMTSYPGVSAEKIQEDKKLVAGGRYRPLSLATFAMELQVFGDKSTLKGENPKITGRPYISHFNNIILYILTTLLLYKILVRLIPPKPETRWYISLPFVVSVLFLAHPIHTEAVANIKGRDEILTLLGSLLALWFTLKYLDTRKFINLIFSGVSLFLGLLSKENAITFLAVIPLTVYYFSKHKFVKTLGAYVPLLIAAGVFLLIRYSILGGGRGEKEIAEELMNNPFLYASVGEKFATIFLTLGKYLQLLFFPHPLTYDYYPKQIPIVGWNDWRPVVTLLAYLALGFYAIWGMIKKRDLISYSIWFYIIPLSVVSNIFFPVGTFMNERFIFISSIGFCILMGWIITGPLLQLSETLKMKATSLSIPLLCILLVLYSGKTFSRNKAWENDFVLFTTDVKTSYNSAKSTCSAGGKLIEQAQKSEIKKDTAIHNQYCRDAIKYLEQSIQIYPEYVDAINLLGNAWYEYTTNSVKALGCYTKVLSLKPYHGIALNNAKIIIMNSYGLLNAGKSSNTPEEILDAIQKLDKIKPGIPELYHLEGTIYGKYLQNIDTAIYYLSKSASLKNPNAGLYMDLGVAYGIKGNLPSALENFLKSFELNPSDAESWYNAGVTYYQMGNMAKANEYIGKSNQLKQQTNK